MISAMPDPVKLGSGGSLESVVLELASDVVASELTLDVVALELALDAEPSILNNDLGFFIATFSICGDRISMSFDTDPVAHCSPFCDILGALVAVLLFTSPRLRFLMFRNCA